MQGRVGGRDRKGRREGRESVREGGEGRTGKEGGSTGKRDGGSVWRNGILLAG